MRHASLISKSLPQEKLYKCAREVSFFAFLFSPVLPHSILCLGFWSWKDTEETINGITSFNIPTLTSTIPTRTNSTTTTTAIIITTLISRWVVKLTSHLVVDYSAPMAAKEADSILLVLFHSCKVTVFNNSSMFCIAAANLLWNRIFSDWMCFVLFFPLQITVMVVLMQSFMSHQFQEQRLKKM